MQRLPVGDVVPVLIFFLYVAAHAHIGRVLRELKNVRSKKAQAIFNGTLQRADCGHH